MGRVSSPCSCSWSSTGGLSPQLLEAHLTVGLGASLSWILDFDPHFSVQDGFFPEYC